MGIVGAKVGGGASESAGKGIGDSAEIGGFEGAIIFFESGAEAGGAIVDLADVIVGIRFGGIDDDGEDDDGDESNKTTKKNLGNEAGFWTGMLAGDRARSLRNMVEILKIIHMLIIAEYSFTAKKCGRIGEMSTTVLSIGGSIINPGEPDIEFLAKFSAEIREWLKENPEEKLVFVAGGGAPARVYQKALRDVFAETGENVGQERYEEGQDWLGIMATRINAQLLKEIFGDLCQDEVNTNPEGAVRLTGRILVGSGYMPGYSSDKDAVVLAKALGADTVVNLSNIEKVYSDDPKKNPNAVPLDDISWADFRAMVGDTWTPGMNTPFDPIASKLAEEAGIRVICAKGTNIENTMKILRGEEFTGTVIR